MVLSDQDWIFDNASGRNENSGLSYIDEYGMSRFLNAMVPMNEYGYFFNPSFHDTLEGAWLRLCAWVDFTVPDPLNDGPEHIPALCAYEDYSTWVAVRGIHTDQNCWPPDGVEDLTVYGVWVNDPLPNGVGQNWYITADAFTTNYWKPISVPGVLRENNYVCVVEPPVDFDESVFDDDKVVAIGELAGKLSTVQQRIFQDITRRGHVSEFFDELSDQMVINAATKAVNQVLVLSGRSLDGTYATVTGNPNNYIVSFQGLLDINAYLTKNDLKLLKFSVIET
jgi:hypothetical protein